MNFPDYCEYDGVGLAELVRKGEVSPAELVEAAIERIERRNGALNAVVFKAYDEARKTAAGALPDGPFRGVPFLVKDHDVAVGGWPTTHGSRFLRDNIEPADSGLVRRFRESGVVLVGKTNAPEFGITGTTEGASLGACRNPWNLAHSTGGSSGGSSAAVAAGIVPMAHAADGLGSIRIPAACCGLVGLKTTRDRNPDLPDGYDYAFGLVVSHVVSRTVRDSAVMLDATGKPEPASPYPAPPKERPYVEEIARAPGRLRIAWPPEPLESRPVDPEVQGALERTAALLRDLGHEVIERPLELDYRALNAAYGPPSAANFAAGMRRLIERVGREPEPEELEHLSWGALRAGRSVTGEEVMWGLQELRMLNRRTLTFFEDIDVYLCPVMTAPPPPLGYLDPVAVRAREVNQRQGRLFPYAAAFNFSGQPSLSLPLAWSAGGLPIGMMFTAKYADEAVLFRLAAQLEKEQPWKDKHPPVWG
ncbi:MAG TPA: amidase family protein [Caulobacteraceae bacterium]|nr:amidase family protein [Caulobacteraceae bacterium]